MADLAPDEIVEPAYDVDTELLFQRATRMLLVRLLKESDPTSSLEIAQALRDVTVAHAVDTLAEELVDRAHGIKP